MFCVVQKKLILLLFLLTEEVKEDLVSLAYNIVV